MDKRVHGGQSSALLKLGEDARQGASPSDPSQDRVSDELQLLGQEARYRWARLGGKLFPAWVKRKQKWEWDGRGEKSRKHYNGIFSWEGNIVYSPGKKETEGAGALLLRMAGSMGKRFYNERGKR